jgi:DNA-directed RNA polymerase specialized sigma24 family protein
MRHVDQMSIEEAAQFLEITFEAAKKRYQRALTRFRELTSHFK